jgi:threonylcarbamoyladenosine tRNA methylthiotransferase MtaB
LPIRGHGPPLARRRLGRVDGLAEGADAVIVNSCSVTHTADAKSRHLVRRARRLSPGAKIALTGCMVETARPEVIEALGADLVYRQPLQERLAADLVEMRRRAEPIQARAFRTRAFVSAQEGCNDVCAFCIGRRTRGRERSKAVNAVVAKVQEREAEECRRW